MPLRVYTLCVPRSNVLFRRIRYGTILLNNALLLKSLVYAIVIWIQHVSLDLLLFNAVIVPSCCERQALSRGKADRDTGPISIVNC